MINLKSYELFERKQTGVIYHYTDPESLVRILGEDRMVAGSYDPAISFSRNHNMLTWVHDFGAGCRIAFDGERMSDRYSFTPHLYAPKRPELFSDQAVIDWRPMSAETRRKKYKEEQEERINKPEISGIKKYIIRVDVLDGTVRTRTDKDIIAKLISDGEIDINYVEKFTPVKI